MPLQAGDRLRRELSKVGTSCFVVVSALAFANCDQAIAGERATPETLMVLWRIVLTLEFHKERRIFLPHVVTCVLVENHVNQSETVENHGNRSETVKLPRVLCANGEC